jgi:hypothetical protein
MQNRDITKTAIRDMMIRVYKNNNKEYYNTLEQAIKEETSCSSPMIPPNSYNKDNYTFYSDETIVYTAVEIESMIRRFEFNLGGTLEAYYNAFGHIV